MTLALREDFAAHRHKMLESADSVIGPAVTRALKRFPNGQWWTPIVDAAERIFRRSFRRETGTNKHPLLQSEVDQFRAELTGSLMRTREVSANTNRRITRWVSTAATNAGVEFAARHDPERQTDREWVTMHDNRVRTAHRHTDGQRRSVTGQFLVGPDDSGRFATMRYPGDPRAPISFWINCRCVLRPVTSLTSGGAMTDTLPETDAHDLDAELDAGPIPWHGVLAPEGVMSGDKRKFKSESLRWRDLPLPLTWQKTSDDGHKGGVTVARIDRIFRDGNLVKGEGVWDTSDDADEALRQIATGMLRGVSVDVDDHTVEAAVDAEGVPESMTFTSGRICGATLVGIPAFQEAFVQLGTWEEADNPPEPIEAEPNPGLEQDGDGGLVADIATSTFISEKPWDGSPARFTDEQYYQSCVLHKNGTSRSKSDNSLPIKEPGGELNRAAVHSAAGMIGKVKGASPEQIASAKRALRGAYKVLGEQAPDSLKASGETEEFGRGPGWITNPVATRRLHAYWVHGPGAAKIGWGTPGDFNRCRVEVGEEIGENSPGKLRFLNQICAQWHHDALGIWPGRPVSAETEPFTEESDMSAPAVNLVASAATPTHRAEFFTDPQLVGPSPLVVSRDGRVFGHLATWNECHIGIGNKCVTAPHSVTDYAYFKTGSVLTEDGEVAVGKITLGGGHADPNLGYLATAEHYDSTSAVVADVTVGDDQFGVWVSGQVRPGTTDEQIAALRAAPLSGDWRKIGNNLELVAALAVNTPGFPIPRPSLAASGEDLLTLTAAGVLTPAAEQPLTAAAVVDEMERRARIKRIRALRVQRNRQKLASLAGDSRGM